MKALALSVVMFVACALMAGCGQTKVIKDPVYVPSTWDQWTALREIRTVWFLNIKELDTANVVQMRLIIQRVWEADRAGKTVDEIGKAFDDRKLRDILINGI